MAFAGNRAAAIDALSVLGADSVKGGEAAIYLFARLPDDCGDDEKVVEWLIKKHGITTIPGSACGCYGHIRVAYANCEPAACRAACTRLKAGLSELVDCGMAGVESFFEKQSV